MTYQTNCTAFHEEKDLAICSVDGVLHLWDAEKGAKKAEYTPASHLTSTFTCLSWKIHRQREAKKNAKSAKRKSNSVQVMSEEIIALGTAAGDILIYHVQTGDLIGKLDGEHTDKVNCICWDPEEFHLFSCSEDQHIVHWDVATYKSVCKWQADKRGVRSVCTAPHSTLLSAGKIIKLWDLATKQLLRRFAGHASPVLSLAIVNVPGVSQRQDATPIDMVEGLYFLSAAIEDRVISAWQIQKKHRKIAVATFALTAEPVSMAVKSPPSKDKPIYLLVLTAEGELNIFSHTLNGQVKKPLEVQMTVKVVDPSAKPLKILSTSFSDEPSETATVLIAYGTTLRVVFERVNLDSFSTKDICLIREDPMKVEISVVENVSVTRQPLRPKDEVTTLAPGVPGHSIKISAMKEQEKSGVKTKRKKTVSVSETEMTMEDRLNAIGLKKDSGDERQPPRADSLCVLLCQGLQSSDKGILNRVLQHSNDDLIRNTIQRLPLPLIVSLIQELSVRLQGQPAAAVKFMKWLRETLKVHSSYLMTFPDLVPLLSKLYQMMSARTRTHSKFIKLEGKLELLTAQIKSKSNPSGGQAVDTAPMFIYEDDSSDEQEDILLDELPADHSESSDNDWEEFSEKDDKDLTIDEEMDEDLVNGGMEED